MERKILLAVDTSARSIKSLQYVSLLFAAVPDVSFHLFSSAICQSIPIDKEWMSEEEFLKKLPQEDKTRLLSAHRTLHESVLTLKRLGIAEHRITTEVGLTSVGVAKDIIFEACKGSYDAMLLCRRGIGKLEEVISGSVSASVLDTCHTVPIWVLDGSVQSDKILLAVDGSTFSLRAADHLSFMVHDNPNVKITLLHCPAILPQKKTTNVADFYHEWGKKWCDKHLTREDSLFHAPQQLLLESGIPAENIQRLYLRDIDPSRRILRQATLDDYGTIVLGRRGKEQNKGIFGGVTDRVLLMAKDVAVWIVG